jgi:hypothetical protein
MCFLQMSSGYVLDFSNRFPALHRGLERDGFTVEGGALRRALPQEMAVVNGSPTGILPSSLRA